MIKKINYHFLYYSVIFCSMFLHGTIKAQQPSCADRVISGQWGSTKGAYWENSSNQPVASAVGQIASSTDPITVKMTSPGAYNTGILFDNDAGKNAGNGFFNATSSTRNTGSTSGPGYPFYTPNLTFKNALKFKAIYDYYKSKKFGTRTITFTFSRPVKEIILNVDKLGGYTGNYNTANPSTNYTEANSAKFTLTTPNVSVTKLKGNSVFELNQKSFYRTTNVRMANVLTGETVPNDPYRSMAAGSLLFTAQAPITSLTFTFTGKGRMLDDYGGNIQPYYFDGVEFLFETCDLDLCESDNNLWFNDKNTNELGYIDVTNGTKTVVCTTDILYGDIAFAPDGKLYGMDFVRTEPGNLYLIDPQTCSETKIPNAKRLTSNATNSLTFLPDGSALRGSGYNNFFNTKKVMRITSINPTREELWHDFSTSGFKDGRPGGDFVIINNKIYISWQTRVKAPWDTKLLEVTFDPTNYKFISVRDLGKLKNNSYGLAVINGELYSAGGNNIYKLTIPSEAVSEIDQTVVHSGGNVFYFGATSLQESLGDVCRICTADPFKGGQDLDTKIGISTIERSTEDWVTSYKNGFIKLESNKYGFIPTRMTTPQRKEIKNPVEGMVIWNTDAKCLELYNGTQWKCASIGCNK